MKIKQNNYVLLWNGQVRYPIMLDQGDLHGDIEKRKKLLQSYQYNTNSNSGIGIKYDK